MNYADETQTDSTPESGLNGLAVAIIAQAVRDYRNGNERDRDTAGAFFRGVWFAFLADSVGLDVEAVRRRLGFFRLQND